MAIKNSRRRMKENPECEMFRRIYRMNIRCFFHLGKNYHLMDYLKVKNDLPAALFHVTSGNNAEIIMKQGLRNQDTKIIFLTNAKKYLQYFLSVKEKPTLLCVDVHRMARDGYEFFRNEQAPWMWIAERIPPEYLSVTTIDDSINLLI